MGLSTRRDERHIRWNCEQSPDDPLLVRYHIVVVDDKLRMDTLLRIKEQLSQVRRGGEPIRAVEESVSGSGLRYLLCSFDSPVAPDVINWSRIGKKQVRDRNLLYERKVGTLEEQVYNFYNSGTHQ